MMFLFGCHKLRQLEYMFINSNPSILRENIVGCIMFPDGLCPRFCVLYLLYNNSWRLLGAIVWDFLEYFAEVCIVLCSKIKLTKAVNCDTSGVCGVVLYCSFVWWLLLYI